MSKDAQQFPACPVPYPLSARIAMAHGGGGTVMHSLLERVFLPAFENEFSAARHDAVTVPLGNQRLAFTTDGFVVTPLEFPGGDIGRLAVFGTVNDLAMAGALPRYLSVGFILEEGLDTALLERVVASMRKAAAEAGVLLVTGDTKVVEHGKADGMYITTAGIGELRHELNIAPASLRPGDRILVSGDLGRHGIAVIASREGIAFETAIESDLACLAPAVLALLEAGVQLRCLRDLTRGGLASAVNELAVQAGLGIELEERAIPVREDVRAACELLGFDPLYVANEGRFVAAVAADDAERTLDILNRHALDTQAAIVGHATDAHAGRVDLESVIGARRVLDMLSGEQLPRIC